MKKILSFLIVMCMLISMVACGGSDDGKTSAPDTSADMSDEVSTDNSADLSEDASADDNSTASTDESNVVSNDEPSSEDESSSVNSSEDSSEESSEESSGESDYSGITDDAAYELYLKLSAADKTLKNRGFKDKGANSDYVPLNYDKMKAMWISQFDFGNLYRDGGSQRSESSFTALVEKAFDNLVSMGFNTVIVQVRPNADSFYPSAYYPWSHYIVGDYGKMGSYDPLKIMIEEAHERKLSFQAWINPMRGMSPDNIAKLNSKYVLSQWKKDSKKFDYLYKRSSDGLCYLNIAREEVRDLIIGGATELVRNYDVDGIHMDDYFYFGEEKNFDFKAYNAAKRENKSLTLQQFRYQNLNTLISGIYSAIKEENKNVLFGISPAGNLDKMADTYYADVETWLSEDGYVDYIMPQIYFGMEHQTWSVSQTYKRWSEITTNPNIKFMPGFTFIKAAAGANGEPDQYAGTGKNEWIENKDVLKKSFQYAVKQPKFHGYAIFSYTNIWNPLTGKENSIISEELKNCKPYFMELIKGEVIKY